LFLIAIVAIGTTDRPANADAQLQALKAVYATRAHGYPSAAGDAQPDGTAPFRWHGYHAAAIDRHDKATMHMHVEPYNPLEGTGVSATKPVRFDYVADHVTEGEKALRVQFPAEALRSNNARIDVHCVASPILSDYHKYRRAAYWPHYRWLKADAYNPGDAAVRVRICGVPLVLGPGANRISVKTADAVGWRGDYPGWFNSVPIEATGEHDITLYFDHFRMEQEVPALLAARGRMFQFPVRGGQNDSALMLWAGFTAIETDTLYNAGRGHGWTMPASKRRYAGLSFRSNENGLIWCRCENADSPLRFDVPNGRWGIWVFATPVQPSVWAKGASATVNGEAQPLFPARSEDEVRHMALSGENWDYRPGSCLWAELVRDATSPAARLLSTDVKNGHVLLEVPPGLALRALILFPEADRQEAERELGRLEYLLAESWDVAHAWVRGAFAEKDRYIGFHDEMTRPETIPVRLDALKLTDADFRRGFVLFQRGLTDAVYPDTIPTPAETANVRAAGFAAPGERECLTIGLLPLAERKGLRLEIGDLVAGAAKIPAVALDVRLARHHHKCMEYGHHNHCYNFQEHFLVRRPRLDTYPGAARRIYMDIAVPADAAPGTYRGELRVVDARGAALATLPLELEVLPIALETPPVFFGIDNGLLRNEAALGELTKYGINFIGADHDTAVQHGFRGYAVWPYDAAPPSFKGHRLGWRSFAKEKELMRDIIAAGKSGTGPRGFFGGYVLNQPGDRDVYASLIKEFPDIDILGVTTPVYAFHGADYTHTGEPWRTQIRTRGKPELLEQAAASGKEFWFVDWLRHSKEQPARFTFGFWLWRLGATGRFSTFTYGGDYHYGTARQSYSFEPYYTLLGVVGGNACPAIRTSMDGTHAIPARDLLLIREGIDDYRYIYTVERLVRAAEAKQLDVTAVRRRLDQLRADLSLDLTRYYESRTASYAENWYPRTDNPWTHERFQEVRRQCAKDAVALSMALVNAR
jgi:hypothetical protein